MTLVIPTLTHGEIEGGFFGPVVNFFRFGKYIFLTKHFLELVSDLAGSPSLLDSRIVSFDYAIYTRGIDDALQDILQRAMPHSYRDIQSSDIIGEGVYVPVLVNERGTQISIGEYTLSSNEYCGITRYLIHGGFMGWGNSEPLYIHGLSEFVKMSEHPLYDPIRKLS